MLRTTSAEWTPWAIASAQATSTAGSPSVSTAVRISTICRLPSWAPASLRRTRSIAAGSTQSLKGAPLRKAPGLRARMLGDDPAVLTDHDAVGIGVNIDGPSDRARRYRIFVVVEAHQAGLRDRCRHCVEPIEPAGIGNEPRPLRLEHFPDRPVRELRIAMCPGVGNAFIQQPGVQLIIVFEPQPRREEALTDQPDLVLDLSLLPARRRSAGDRIDEVMAAHPVSYTHLTLPTKRI